MTRHPLLQADVFVLARDRGTIDGAVALTDLPRLAASLLSSDGALTFVIRGHLDDLGRPAAAMLLRATLPMECQRCGGRVDVVLDREARFRFVADDAQLGATPDDDDEVDVIVGSPRMDLAPWIEDEAILSLPLVPRHEPGDPRCRPAVPLGAGDAEDGKSGPANPFSVLAGLKPGARPN